MTAAARGGSREIIGWHWSGWGHLETLSVLLTGGNPWCEKEKAAAVDADKLKKKIDELFINHKPTPHAIIVELDSHRHKERKPNRDLGIFHIQNAIKQKLKDD